MNRKLLFLLTLMLSITTAFGQIAMPTYDGGSTTKDVGDETAFYDGGGKDGDIKAWQTTAVVLKPRAGEVLELTFTSLDLKEGAYIAVFQGKKDIDESDDGYGNYEYSIPYGGNPTKLEEGATMPMTIRSVAPSKPLTVMFTSANGGSGTGWVASVKSVPLPPPTEEDAPSVVKLDYMPKIYRVGETEIDFYDDGGKDGKISESFEGYVTFKPKDPAKFIKITFSKLDLFDTYTAKNDKFEFFKGTSTAAADLFKTLLDEPTPITIKSTEAGQGITVKLKSITGYTKSGWEAKVVEFTPSPMEFKALTSTKGEEGDVSAGAEGVKMMNFDIKTKFALTPLTLNKVKLNLGTDIALVKAVKLYGFDAKGDEKLLATETNITSAELELTLNEAFSLAEGKNSFFVSYDVVDTAENGKKLSAQLQAVTLASTEHQATSSTAFERPIKNVVYSTDGTTTKHITGDWEFTHTEGYNGKYQTTNKKQITTFLPANADEKIEIDFKDFDVYYSSRSYGTKATFIIYDGNGTNGTILWQADKDNKDKGPEALIRSKSADGAITILFKSETTSSYYAGKGWHATVRSYKPSPMSFDALEVTQVEKDNPVLPNKDNQPILSLNFKTAGGLNPIHLKGLKLNLKGSEGQLKSVKLYATESKGEFATDNLVKSIEPKSGTIEVALDNALVEGDNFLWLCYELKEDVPSDTPFDAKVEAYTLSTGSEVSLDVSLGDPDGERISKNIYLLEAGEDIKDVKVTSSLLFYDDGGKDGNVTRGFKGAVHFIPNEGEVIKLVFKKLKLSGREGLEIFKGKSKESSELILKTKAYKAPEKPILAKESADGSLTIYYSAGKYGTREGWEIEVISYKPLPLSLEAITSAEANSETEALAGAKAPFLTLTAKVVGDKGAFVPLQSLKVETTGTTDVADIEKLLIYATDNTKLFSEAKLVGEAVPSADGSATTITINQDKCKVSEAGEHKYTLVALTKASAKAGNTIALKVTEANTTAIDSPAAASRTIKEGLKGTYTVGARTDSDYKDFAEVLEALKGGVSGAVVFEVEDATYPKLEIPEVNGLSETNTLTIRPKSGELGGVIFENNKVKPSGYDPNAPDYAVINLNNTSNINLEKLVVQTQQKDYDAVILVKSSPNVSIKGCKVVAPRGVTTAEDVILINSKGNGYKKLNIANNLSVEDCELVGGRQAIYLNANRYRTEMPQSNITIKGNRLKNQGFVPIYSKRVTDLLIEDNQITANGDAGNDFFAMDIVLMKGITIKNNVIEAYGMTKTKNRLTIAGLHFRQAIDDDMAKFTGANTVINNTIRLVPEADQEAYAFFFNGSKLSDLSIAHNTVKIIAPNSTDKNEETAIAKITGGSKKEFKNIHFYGNLLQNLAEGSAYKVFGSWDGSGIKLSYNAIYANAEKFALVGGEDKTFEEWKTLVTEFYHDKLAKATFRSFASMELDEEGDFTFVPKAGVKLKYDIVGKERKSPATVGAYEFVEGTLPVFDTDYPKLSEATFNSAKLEFKANASGTMFYIVKKKSETAPTLDEVAGSDQSLSLETNTALELPLADLEEETQYTIYTLLVSPRGEKATELKTLDFTTKKQILPLKLTLAEKHESVVKGGTVHIVAELEGGLAPYTYKWTNAMNEVISTEQEFDYKPEISQVLNLVATDAQGKEIEGVTELHVQGVKAIATFEDLYLADESHWAGKRTGNFYSGSYAFNHNYNTQWGSWTGFSYTNSTSTTFDRNNYIAEQYNSAVGSGVDGSKNYGVIYSNGTIQVNNQEEGEEIAGFYITNTANTILCVNEGAGFGDDKPFAKGDFVKLTATADNGKMLDYYLADYRSDNPKEHYALKTWAYLDLSSLGKVKNVKFSFSSSRNNKWGNTMPAYFCLDNVGAKPKVEKLYLEVEQSKLATFDLHKLLDEHLPAKWAEVAQFKIGKEVQDDSNISIQNNQLKLNVGIEGLAYFTPIVAQGHGEAKYFSIEIRSKNLADLQTIDEEVFKLYPTPAVHSIAMTRSGLVRIYSLSGKLVLETANYEAGTRLDISSLPSGTYIVKLGNKAQRLIKQ